MTRNAPVNQFERACRTWPVLVTYASKKMTITYGQLANQLNTHPRTIRFILGIIQDYCLKEKLPPLTILVVEKGSKKPGTGFIAWDVEDFESGLKKVYEFNWDIQDNPFGFAEDDTTEDQIVQALVDTPQNAEDVYRRVKVRGSCQAIFRKLMLQVYKKRCAFCGLSFEDALEAAHIVPWGGCHLLTKISSFERVIVMCQPPSPIRPW